ncbi:MAG TPA: hypothetical protein VIU38_06920 [Anaerolineales bacterium]
MRTFRHETPLYLLALFIGLLVRLIGLGALPLSDLEAGWALQALHVAQGTRVAIGSQPAYVVLTAAIFYMFGGSSNFLARLIPALTGSAMILVPALFRERLKPRPAVILAFALALEPGLTALSRQAGSAIMVVTFTLAAWGLWKRRMTGWAGICAGLALLSGSALWPGLLGLGVAWALFRPFADETKPKPRSKSEAARVEARREWLTAATCTLGTIVLLGSMFMLVPGGLSAWIAGLPEYITGWTRNSDISASVMLASLLAYEPLAVLLALVATVRGWLRGSVRVRQLSLWMLVALLVATLQTSRQVTDLAWMLIPMWALAALELGRWLEVSPEERREVLIAAAWCAALLVFVWFDFLQLRRPGLATEQSVRNIIVLVGSIVLLAVSFVLIAAGWSTRVAMHGLAWGLAACLGVYSTGALMAAAGHRNLPNGAELWRPGAQLPMADLLLRTIQDQSAWSDKDMNSQPVVIAGIDSPALEWLLRDRPVEVRTAAGAESKPPMVITPDTQDPVLVTGYRGQSFVWRSKPTWRLFKFAEWLPFHESTHENETVILWVRNDLFPDLKPTTAP